MKRYQPSFAAVDGRPKYFDCSQDILHLKNPRGLCWSMDSIFDERPGFAEQVKHVRHLAYSNPTFDREAKRGLKRGLNEHVERILPFESLETYVVASRRACVAEYVFCAVNAWVRAMEEKAGLEEEKTVQLPVVYFRNAEGFTRALSRLGDLREL